MGTTTGAAATVTAVTAVTAARTAVRPVNGELARWNPVVLAGAVGHETLERAGLDAGVLDEVVVGCRDPVGAAGADAARAIVLAAGWPTSVGGSVIDRGETSGAAAVQAAAAAIGAGQARTVLVVGLGLCSVVPPGAAALNRSYGAPWGGVAERFKEVGGLLPAPRLSERAARAVGAGRADLDAAAEESRRRATAAGTSPAIVAVAARPADTAERGVHRGDPVADDALREWGEASDLPPAFDDDGLLTAATFAPPADCVTAVLLQAGSEAPCGATTAVGTGRAAGHPFDPVGNVSLAVDRALDSAGVDLSAVDDLSVVEHDAATVTLVARALDIDSAPINRRGGALATGNAGAAEELRLIADALAFAAGERLVLTVSAGPTGSAAVLWRTRV